MLGQKSVNEAINAEDWVVDQETEEALEAATATLEEHVVDADVDARDLQAFRGEDGEEAKGISPRERLKEPGEVAVSPLDIRRRLLAAHVPDLEQMSA